MFFNFFLSFWLFIFFETPPLAELFVNNTQNLPGKDIKVLTAAPLLPLSSFII